MQMRMMYGTKEKLDQCEFCPGAVYFITDTCEIWFDAPDREERIRMTLNPEQIECDKAITNSRIASFENALNETEAFLRELSSISFPSYSSGRY